MKIEEIAQLVAKACIDKKAIDTKILHLEGLSIIADYFVITHGNSETQVQAIATSVKEKMGEAQIDVRGIEGYEEARWVLIDLGDVVVHIFHRDERDFYNLEKLWADAPMVPVEEEAV